MQKKQTSTGANLGFEEKLWKAADKMRGHMDTAEYKHVALGLIFLKYISDAFQEHYDKLKSDKLADPEDRDEYTGSNIFWVPKVARWKLLQDNAKQPTIGKLLDEAMMAIEKVNPSLKGALPKEYARPTLDKHRLGELVDLIGTIGLGDKENRSKDILGRVYEYFLSQFASKEGKKGGEFYTPRCVVKLLVEMIEPYKGRIYDPCCGSSGMFVQSEEFIKQHGGRIGDIAIYGQESNPTTWKLAKMNLAIRGIEADLGSHNADTFHNDLHKDLKADFILANPPFNMKDWGGERLKDDIRWKYGTPPEGNANYGWIQHMIHHLSPNGIAGFVMSNVSLSSESQCENDIRKKIIEQDFVDCVVALPGKLFYSTPIPACLWFVSRGKENKDHRNRNGETLFIDASTMGMAETRTHSYLSEDSINKIVATYHSWRNKNSAYKDMPGFCRSVSIDDIRNSENYSLFPEKYVEITADKNVFNKQDALSSVIRKSAIHKKMADDLIKVLANVQPCIDSIATCMDIPISFEEVTVSDFLESRTERLGSRQEPEILTCTEKAGLILQRERFAKRVATDDTSKYKMVYKTDIVYNPYLLWAGAIDQCWIVDVGITSPAYEILKVKKDYDPTFIGILLKSPQMIKMYGGISVGTVQRRRRAPVEKFLNLRVVIPARKHHSRFQQITSVIQNEVTISKQLASNATQVLLDICNMWTNHKGFDILQ